MCYYPFITPYTQAHPHLSPNMPHFKSASCVDFQVTATLSFPDSPRACHLWCHNSVKHHVVVVTSQVSSACDPLSPLRNAKLGENANPMSRYQVTHDGCAGCVLSKAQASSTSISGHSDIAYWTFYSPYLVPCDVPATLSGMALLSALSGKNPTLIPGPDWVPQSGEVSRSLAKARKRPFLHLLLLYPCALKSPASFTLFGTTCNDLLIYSLVCEHAGTGKPQACVWRSEDNSGFCSFLTLLWTVNGTQVISGYVICHVSYVQNKIRVYTLSILCMS